LSNSTTINTDSKIEQRYADFFAAIKETEFNRGGTSGGGVPGLKPFIEGRVPDAFKGFYSPEELEALSRLKGTQSDVEERMRVKLTEHYLSIAQSSEALRNLVKARPEETFDLSGEADPSNQNNYSPVPGLLHKYEMALIFSAATCSAHCRYCYRLDLFSGKTGKAIARVEDVVAYIKSHNEAVAENGGVHPKTGRPRIRESLLSGGDPMVLPNARLGKFLVGLAEAGLDTVRIGTKELAFFPYRFDTHFFNMLDQFHTLFPQVRVVFAVHFSHPDEFLAKDELGHYIPAERGHVWRQEVEVPVRELTQRRHFISLENQTPIIHRVNDDPTVLRLLQRELYHHGVGNHYFFQCREIEGHKAFAVPLETTWKIFTESQKGLSGVEKHARFVMSTEHGKMEVIGLTQDGLMVFRMLRAPENGDLLGRLIIAKSNPDALWLTGYMDRIVSDGTGILKKA